jgi:diaminopimelate decarboxylase
MVEQISTKRNLKLVGIHCHLGSTIETVEIFKQTIIILEQQFKFINHRGIELKYINLGGGLGIDYHHQNEYYPTASDLVRAIKSHIPHDSTLILEPGRSIVGNAGMLVCKVIGVKRNSKRSFIIIDGSMTELIRPSLYQAYHHIEFIEPVISKIHLFDIVGPVCESGDYMGKDRWLPEPPEGTGIAIFDSGAYGYAMSSNYNARMKPAEFMVSSGKLDLVRRAEKIDDFLKLFDVSESKT